MNQEIIVINWMALILLVPATAILVWKMVSVKLKGNSSSSDLMTVALLLGVTLLAVLGINIGGVEVWLRMALSFAQLILLVFLFKRLWAPLKQILRG